MALPFAAIETANAAGIVSYNGWHPVRTASADSLAGPGSGGRKNRGFRFAAPNVVAATTHWGTGTAALGGTLTLSSGVINTSSGIWPTTSLAGFTVNTGGLNRAPGAFGAFTLTGNLTIDSAASGGEFHVGSDGGSGTVTVGGGSILVGGPGNAAVWRFGINPGAITDSGLSSGVVNFSGGTINVNGWMGGELTGASEIGLLKVGSGTLTLAGGVGSGTLNITSGGTLTLEASQTLAALNIGSSGSVVVLGNGVAPPAPVEDASGQSSQPVPEPAAAALLAMSAAALLARRIRNRK